MKQDREDREDGGMDPRGEKPSGKTKNGRRTAAAVLLALFLLAGGAYAYWMLTTKAPPKTVEPTGLPSANDLNTDRSERVHGGSDRYYTLLIVGKDVEPNMNTDTMMLCRYDSVEHKLNVCSLPRDTLTNIPADIKKLNNAYASRDGDIEALLNSVKDIAGFRPDSYVMIDTEIFSKMIDEMGGVWFDVPEDMFYDDGEQNLHMAIEKGYQKLSGADTMKVFRFRYTYTNGDLQRIELQHKLIEACAEQWLQLRNWTRLMPAAKLLIDNAQTNLSYGNMQWYAKEFFKLSTDDISFMTVPCTGCMIRRFAYVSIKVDDWMTMVNASLNPTATPIKKESCNILYQLRPEGSTTSISAANYAVTNGSEIAGGAESFRINSL